MLGQYIFESNKQSLRMIKVNMLQQHSALSYKNNNQKLYNIYTLLNQVICTLHTYIYIYGYFDVIPCVHVF